MSEDSPGGMTITIGMPEEDPCPDESKPSVWRAVARSTFIAWGPADLLTSVSSGESSEADPDGLDGGVGAQPWVSEFRDASFDPVGCHSASSSSLSSLALRQSLRAGGAKLTLGAAEPPPDGVLLAAFVEEATTIVLCVAWEITF
ncbi:unnamed protein product [Phytophthora fragariaefolia]|uniref:Unnamed protein product n=1 Tax=Phytophthora fragariaefolia TaxID=1490495 RepID=A0A9W6XI81_9STRA|nr:unnamed protein product [Phytophthora fragariaefolia]